MYVSAIQHRERLTLTLQKDAWCWSWQMSMPLCRNIKAAQRTTAFPLFSFVQHLVLDMVYHNKLGTWKIFPSVILLFQHVFQSIWLWALDETHLCSKQPTHLLSLSSRCPLGHERHSASTMLFHLNKSWINSEQRAGDVIHLLKKTGSTLNLFIEHMNNNANKT